MRSATFGRTTSRAQLHNRVFCGQRLPIFKKETYALLALVLSFHVPSEFSPLCSTKCLISLGFAAVWRSKSIVQCTWYAFTLSDVHGAAAKSVSCPWFRSFFGEIKRSLCAFFALSLCISGVLAALALCLDYAFLYQLYSAAKCCKGYHFLASQLSVIPKQCSEGTLRLKAP